MRQDESCPRPDKVAYYSKKAAKRQAGIIRGKGGPKLHEYHCVCGLFHLGTLPGWVKKGYAPRAR